MCSGPTARRSRHPLRRLALLIGALVAAAALLAPAGAPADVLPQPGVQAIKWHRCGLVFSCGTLSVPVNYAEPGGTRLEVALMRKSAREKKGRLGSILINPGGPGGSGIDLLRNVWWDRAFGALNRRHALIGFDPRGVGDSTRVRCGRGSSDRLYAGIDDQPLTPALFAPRVQRYVAGCEKRSGRLLPFLGTADVARDMEQIRRSLGEPKLGYFGYSYGSFLGATYAALFPDSVGQMVLDGADDPDQYANRPLENDVTASAANEAELQRFLAYARRHAHFGRGTPLEAYRRIERGLARRPLHTRDLYDGTPVRIDDSVFRGVILDLTSVHSAWRILARMLGELGHRDGREFADWVSSSSAQEDDASSAAFFANSGIDRAGDPAGITDAYVASAAAASPSFPADAWTSTQVAALWPRTAARFAGPWSYPAGPGRTPIVVIGTTHDPRTVYPGAVAARAQLGNAVLVTLDGDGHTAFDGDNGRCIDGAVIDYFDTGALPPDGTRCRQPAP